MKAILSFIAGFVCVASFATDTNYPKTLAELNAWYIEPPAGSNAATYYLQGFAALRITDADSNSVNLPVIGKAQLPSPEKPLPPAMRTAINAFVARNKIAFPYIEQGAKFEQSRYPMDMTHGAATLLPHLGKIKRAAQVLELSAISKAIAGEGKQAGEDVLIGFSLGQSLEAEPMFISQLVRVASAIITVNGLEQALNHTTLPLETLDRLQKSLSQSAEHDATGVGFARSLVGERLFALDWFNLPPEKFLEITTQLGKPIDTNTLQLLRKNKDFDQKFIGETFDQVSAAWKQKYPERLKVRDVFEKRSAESAEKELIISSLLLPALTNLVSREAGCLAYLRLAQTAAALERYRALHDNQYPESLTQMTRLYLAAVPKDPFDGQPLRYRKAGNGYVLYSVGANLKDDSGARGKFLEGDLVFAVINPPRRPQ